MLDSFLIGSKPSTATSCMIRDGEMKLAEFTMKIADLEKEIATKSKKLSLLTSQKDPYPLTVAPPPRKPLVAYWIRLFML